MSGSGCGSVETHRMTRGRARRCASAAIGASVAPSVAPSRSRRFIGAPRDASAGRRRLAADQLRELGLPGRVEELGEARLALERGGEQALVLAARQLDRAEAGE